MWPLYFLPKDTVKLACSLFSHLVLVSSSFQGKTLPFLLKSSGLELGPNAGPVAG